MLENRLKARIKSDAAIGPEDYRLIEGISSEKLTSYEEAIIASEKAQDDYLYPVLSELSKIPFVRTDAVDFPEDIRNILPESILRKYYIIPQRKITNSILEVVTTEPLNLYVFDEIYQKHGFRLIAKYAERFRITSLLNSTFGDSADLRTVLASMDEVPPEEDESNPNTTNSMDKISAAMSDEKDAPTVKYVNTLFKQAIKMKASDLHIEPRQKKLLIRFRIDGVLREIPSPPKHLQDNIITIFKVMADLDISEKRAPQDGRIRLPFEGREIDFRVSSLPTIYGEKIVIRVLDTSSIVLEFPTLGFSKADEISLRKVMKAPHGIILAAGPTGSGKTTTLYTVLKEVATDDKNVSTLEDPVEYRLDKLSQCQVEVKAGMTFAAGLRALLRQDPDIIMVGEIRDLETAELAIQASLTGHMVLSTIHTNSAIGTINRLGNMGCDSFLVAATITAIIAQRLIRTLCSSCKEEYIASADELASMGVRSSKPVKLFRENGCDKCGFTGFKGRAGIHEIFIPDDHCRELIGQQTTEFDLFRYARKKCGLKTLKESGIRKVIQGATTFAQVLTSTS
ncbi:MAG: type II secretion system protein GspE [Candidatus Cloacimonadota bacterium]|nr:MAG: type II secretion system protein GspE [Candidatus Cloacimonadota bacterium]